MLADILPVEAFGFLLIMTRLSAIVLFMPGLGDRSIPGNIRVFFAIILSAVFYPVLRDELPVIPDGISQLVFFFGYELLMGSIIALAARILMTSMHTAGTIIAFQTGLSSAQNFDPSQGAQSALISTFLTLIAVTLIFTSDAHHLMIMGFLNSYKQFPIGGAISATDFASVTIFFVGQAFKLGFLIASPFIVFSIMFNASMGLIARLIPQFQVFFVGLPLNIFLGFWLLSVTIGGIGTLFLEHFESLLLQLVG